jgi:Tfp pilus assembly protein PilO
MKSVISIIFIGAAAVIFFNWTQPVLNEIKSLYEQEATLNSILSNFREFQTSRDDILSKYNSVTKEDMEKLNKLIPSAANAIDLVVITENMAKNSGLILKNIDVKKPEDKQKATFDDKKSSVGNILVTMKVTGSYKSFVSFLENLEKNLRLVEIERLSFVAGETDLYEYNIIAETFWKK